MSRRAWTYIWSVLIVSAVLTGAAMLGLAQAQSQWPTFAALLVLATLAQLLEAVAPGRQSYYPTMVFLFAGVLLLHPSLFVLLVSIPHLLEWLRARMVKSPRLRDWYIQPFNIATHIISGLVAYLVYTAGAAETAAFGTASLVLAATAAAFVYLFVNHFLVGQALVLARGLSWSESGVMNVENLLSDFTMLYLGFAVAILWKLSPWVIVPALFPLLLIYRALKVPQLKKEAQTDDKTGLWNARHFIDLYVAELQRAKRFNRPLALIMADLDLLRNINNNYGHLAGDKVLETLGQIISENTREYDIAGRFGGEEFCIVLPEAELAEARSAAEHLRKTLENMPIEVSTSSMPIRATMSIGVACFPSDATAAAELIEQADQAMYQAKLMGRNRVECASEVPHFIRLGAATAEDRLAHPEAVAAAFGSGPEPTDGGRGPNVDAPAIRGRKQREVQSRAAEKKGASRWLPLFVSGVVFIGAIVAMVGWALSPRPDLFTIGLFTFLAMIAELFEVNVYGPNTISISVAVVFAAAVITGLPGVTCVSAGIALVHWVRMRPPFYSMLFNWATHILAGLIPALAITLLPIPVQVSNLLLLLAPAVMAALSYYVIDTGLIAIAINLSQGTGVRVTWREQFRWLAEHYLVLCIMGLFMGATYTVLGLPGIFVFALPLTMMYYVQRQYVERTEHSMYELRRMNVEVTAATEAIRQLNEELFLTLAKVIEARDPFVSGHSARVADYAVRIATELGLSPERIENLRQAAYLHDIGKIGVSEHILQKPGSLSPEEYEEVKSHSALGADFLETCQGLRHLAPFVRHHHERWDGTGYPDGLRGEQITLEARILATCDAVEAMASDRPYRGAMSLSRIVTEIRKNAGTQLDPLIAETFIHLATQGPEEFITNSAGEVSLAQTANGRGVPQMVKTNQSYVTVTV